jgi:alpha-1,3-rhamnosyltransferase|tara:strand:- start:708 stop:1490 length:783 start_codon:yes stop_codon:yes gene_type:complete
MSLPRVTVLIANYNDEKYIDNAIESAVNQDYLGPLTICIVDDGSEDSSWGIISSYFKDPTETEIDTGTLLVSKNAGRYNNTDLVAIRSTNSGPSEARNIGINHTIDDTDIYAILDSDDEMYENKISECISVFKQGDGMIGVVYADYDTIHVDSGRIIREFKEPYSRRRLTQECVVHSGSLILKEALQSALEDTGYYDKTMRTCEDYDLWMRISEKYIIAHVPKALTKVRVTGDNSSFIINKETWQKNWLRVMEKTQLRTK